MNIYSYFLLACFVFYFKPALGEYERHLELELDALEAILIEDIEKSVEEIKERAKENRQNGVGVEEAAKRRDEENLVVSEKSIQLENGGVLIVKESKVNGRKQERIVVIDENLNIKQGKNVTSCSTIGAVGDEACK